MSISSKIFVVPLLSIWSLCFIGCREENTDPQQVLDVEINFEVVVGDEPFRCGVSYNALGSTSSTVAFHDMRFYVYDVSLIDEDGKQAKLELEQDGVWQNEEIALLDFEDGCENGNEALNSIIKGTIPQGSYRGLSFSIGIPPELNTPETILEGRGSPLNLNAMYWSWRSGYKYMRLDTDLPFFRFHLGANACDDAFVCDEPNVPTFEFERFNHRSEKILLDLKTLLSDSDLTQNTEGTAPGCMGQSDDPDCQKIFDHFNLGGGDSLAFSVIAQ